MPTIYVDNKPYQVKDGLNLLHACLSLGFDLPYFCWHPKMHSVGACRQCAVKQFKDEKDVKGRIVMSCMTPAKDGTRISIDDPEAKAFRKGVIEWMMVNHPHDCPVCDEGGECHLQDMTVMTGQVYRRYRGKKRTYRNQDLGPFITHEMNRCIQCYRCVRFYRDYAGGRDLDVFSLNHAAYFGRHADGALENEFSGNLVEVCPTGVFTDRTLARHYTRKWDLQTAPSICVHCSVGCNTIPGERYKTLRRIRNRYNREVNGYFLCDRGRFGYEFVNSADRIRYPLISQSLDRSISHVPPPLLSDMDGGRIWVRISADKHIKPSKKEITGVPAGFEAIHREALLEEISGILLRSTGLIGIGSPRASLESNFALRELVGQENFYSGMSEQESRLVSIALDILRRGPARSASLQDVEQSDAVLVLGEDPINSAPMLGLALHQSVRRAPMERLNKTGIPFWNDAAVREYIQNEKGPLFIASPYRTRLDGIATKSFRAAPDDLARLGFAIARELDPDAPPVPALSNEISLLAREIAQTLKAATRPLVVSGVSCGSESLLRAAANISRALTKQKKSCGLSLIVPECNSMGLGLMAAQGLRAAFKAVREEKANTVIILENDLYRRADEASVNAFFGAVKHVILMDHLYTKTSSRAHVVLPAAAFAEADGTLVNYEGRAQRFYQVFVPGDAIRESWLWVLDIARSAPVRGTATLNTLSTFDSVEAALAERMPFFKPILDLAPPASFRIAGRKIARQPHRYSGRTAIHADQTMYEPKPPGDPDSPLAFTMEGYQGSGTPSSLIPRYWAPGWNSDQAINKFQQEVGGSLRGGDPGVRLIEPDQTSTLPSSLPSREGEEQETSRTGAQQPHPRPLGERAGVRGGTGTSYFENIPGPFTQKPGEWLIVPRYHIFGSEELSVLSPGIAERAPRPYIALNPEDLNDLHVQDGEEVECAAGDGVLRLPVRSDNSLPKGIAAIPAGPDMLGAGRCIVRALIKGSAQ